MKLRPGARGAILVGIPAFDPAKPQAPNSKLQTPKKHQAPSPKTDLRADSPGICFWGLGFELWNFSGAWGLVLGVSLSGGSKTGMRPWQAWQSVATGRPEFPCFAAADLFCFQRFKNLT